jgi:hypothetical protein
MIGANHLPECMRLRMAQSPLAVVEDPFAVRLERLREEYFARMHHDFLAAYGEGKAGRRIANICIMVCSQSAAASGYSVLPSSPPGLMKPCLSSSEPPAPKPTSAGWFPC